MGVPVLDDAAGDRPDRGDDPLCFGIPGTLASRAANFTLQSCDFCSPSGTRLDLGSRAQPGGWRAERAR